MARSPEVPWKNPEPAAPKKEESAAQKKADKALFGGTKGGDSKGTPFEKERPGSKLDKLELEAALDKKEREFENLEADAAAAEELEEKLDRVGEIFAEISGLEQTLKDNERGKIDRVKNEKYGRITDAMILEKTDEAIEMIESAKKDIERKGTDPEAIATDIADLDVKLHSLRSIKEGRIRHSGIESAKKNIDSIIVDPEAFKNEALPVKKAESPKPAPKRRAIENFSMEDEEPTTIRTRREDGTFEKNFGLTPENPAKKKPKSLWEKGLDLLKGKGKK